MDSAPSGPDRLFAEFRRSGDPRALGQVYDQLAPELLGIALHTARDPAEAEDVLQATFLAAIEQAQRFDPAQRVLPWLVGILANETRKARERGARRPDPERFGRARAAESPEEEAQRLELLARLDDALARLPEAFRPVLVLRLRHGLAVPEIAAALERPPGTVRSQLARGTELLRRALPAGLAGALAFVAAPPRGLAAVRTSVLEHAAALHGPPVAATVLGGILAVKKLAAVAALLISAVSLVLAVRSSQPARARAEANENASLLPPRAPERPARAAEEPLAVTREALATSPASLPVAAPPTATTDLVVTATWADGGRAAGELVLVLDALGQPDQDEWQAFTDEHGIARFEDLAPGPAHVHLLRGGESSVVLARGQTTPLELALRAGVTVAGRVLDEHGEPVPGAEVWLSERYYTNRGHGVARAGADGTFELRAVGPDHWLGARAPGHEPSGLVALAGGGGDRRELTLVLERRGARVRGRVLDELGQPLARAQVLLGREQPERRRAADGSEAPGAPPQTTRTDAGGAFELPCTPLGLQPLQVRARGRAPYLGELEVLDDDRNAVEITLLPSPRLVGRVRGPDGRPLAGVDLRAGEPGTFASRTTVSQLDGRFELSGLGLARQTIVAQHASHGEARLEVQLAAGETRTWDVELRAAPRIHGRLVDARGNPLRDLVVVALRETDRTWRSRSNRTDASGGFSIGDLEECAHLVWVQPALESGWRGFPLLERRDVWPAEAPLELTVPTADERARIAAEVVAHDGTPVIGAELQVWHQEAEQWRSFTSAGARGAILAEGVPAGTVELELRHADHPWKPLGRHALAPGDTLDLGRIELAAAGRLVVRLTGAGAEPGVEHQLVATLSTPERESGVARIENGGLVSGALAPGEHLLVLGGDGFRQLRQPFRIEAGLETRLELALERCGLREVDFALPAGVERAKWIACSLLDARGQLVWGAPADCTRTPPRARVSAPPGTYTFSVGGAGGLAGQAELVLPVRGVELPALVLVLAPRP